jgi:cyclohexanone monooxygenase
MERKVRNPTRDPALRRSCRRPLRPDIQFETRVTSAVYDEVSSRWTVTTDQGDKVSARFYIMASRCLSSSKLPETNGLETYRGDTYHTGRWPHDGVDCTGKRVAVMRTGSSSIQYIPTIADQAAHLTVFQKTPNFSLPAKNGPNDSVEVAAVKARYRQYRAEPRM